MTELLSLAEKIVEQAAPNEQVEAYVVRGSSTEVKAYNGEVESFTSASSAGVGIRVIANGRAGIAHAGTHDPEAIAETLAEARDNMAFAEPDEWVRLAEPDGLTPVEHDHWDNSVEDTPTADKVQMALDLEKRATGIDPRVSAVRVAAYSDQTGEAALASSTGIRAYDRGTGAHVSVSVLAKDGDETQIGGGFDVNFGTAALDLNVAAEDAVLRATRLLGATQPKSQKLTIVLEPRMAASIFGLTVRMLNGSSKIKGRTPFLDREGEQVASPLLTLVDDGTDGRSFGATSVDGEGLTCRKNELISEGVLQQFLHNSYTGNRSGDGTTANAVRGYRSSPSVGSHAVIVTPGEMSFDELVASVGTGVLVTSMSGMHSGVNAISGDFSVGAEGLMIRDGELAEPIREATIASTLQKMLTDIVAIGGDLEWQPGGTGSASMAIGDVSLSGV